MGDGSIVTEGNHAYELDLGIKGGSTVSDNTLYLAKINKETHIGQEFLFDLGGQLYKAGEGSMGRNYVWNNLEEIVDYIEKVVDYDEEGKEKSLSTLMSLIPGLPKKEKYRSLDNGIIKRYKNGGDIRFRRLGEEKKMETIKEGYSLAEESHEVFQAAGELNGRGEKIFSKILEYDYDLLEKEADEFQELFSRPFFPPSNYDFLYLESTEGCHHNECKMCDFYTDIEFNIKDLDEFEEHIDEALEFHEGTLGRRKGVFLGSANTLAMKTEDIVERLEMVNEKVYPHINPPTSYHVPLQDHTLSFADVRSINNKDPEDFRKLSKKGQGLSGIFIGAESGSRETLEYLNKLHTKPKEIIDATKKVKKKSNIQVGMIFLVGLPGNHFEKTVELMENLPLTKGDAVFLSKLRPGGSIQDVDKGIVEEQMEGFQNVLTEKSRKGVGVLTYYIDDFFYS